MALSGTKLDHTATTVGKSTLTRTLEDEGERTPTSSSILSTRLSSPKPRSLSDAPKPTLSPSPAFREPAPRLSKDDTFSSPTTPKRPTLANRGLSLQIHKDGEGSPAMLVGSMAPLSPKLDPYGSPASMLPRRSRGLDYTRACTNLHHSTLAESSPDASPTIGGRGMLIPQRRSLGSTVLDSPSNLSSSLWSAMPGSERTALSSSVSSINMLDSGSDSESSSDEDMDRDEDPMINTPAASRLNAPLLSSIMNSPGGEWMGTQTSPAPSNLNALMSFRRSRLNRRGKSRHSSSSVSINSSKPSPGPLSPPLTKSIEAANGGYFNSGLTRQQVQSRRESLSLGTDHLHLSDSEDGEGRVTASYVSSAIMDSPGIEGPRGVVRRAVTRRGNLLPKTKHFARVKAALLEEAAPVDSEARREAEVIRQVQDNDSTAHLTTATSTILQPPTPLTEDPLDSSPEDGDENTTELKASLAAEPFSRHAQRNSAGLGFWHDFDERYRTPPPQPQGRETSGGNLDENLSLGNGTVASSLENPNLASLQRTRSRSTTPLAGYPQPTAGDVARKVNNKRRRDDDFDPASFKRRAVSPGMSVASSPILPQSPVFSSEKSWGLPPMAPKTNGHESGRSNSGGSIGNGSMKRVGMQGMMETNDAIMAMSID